MEPSRPRAQPRVPFSANRSFGLGASHQDDIGHTPPRSMGSWRAMGPADNTKQAATSVVSGRKLFNRAQNTSRVGSNTTRSFSDVPTNTPGRIFASSSSFRSGLTNGSGPKFAFSPRVPASTIREKFPAVASGRSFRGPSVDLSGRALSKTAASSLFTMRITSPPPELDGEELAKRVPEDPNRVGSIYADEYLAHLVPSELDELQRRQFFCILDLRRLKYAANEIFAKKDWRVNIMNFAKEYEKSRSLIMLRYGLYEFKTVPASREVLKKWKMEHNIPDEDEEMVDDVRPKPAGGQGSFRSGKRRAEDDLNATSGSSQAKRRVAERSPLNESAAPTFNAGATPFAKKTKRVSDDIHEDEENQPNKIQKSKPSATLSIFEQVANNSPDKRTASPAKQAPKAVTETSTVSKSSSNLFAQPAQSILSGGSKTLAPSSNIFGHLSEQNTPAGSDGEEDSEDDAEGEGEEEEEEEEEGQGEGESDNDVEEISAPAAKTAPAAPAPGAAPSSLFGGANTTTPSGGSTLFGQGASFMGRVSKTTEAETNKAAEIPSSSPLKAKNQTWNPNTPIKFGTEGGGDATSTPVFGAKTTQPASLFAKPTEAPSFKFGATETPKPTETSAFGTQVKDFASETPKTTSSSLFGQASKPADADSSPFGNTAKTPMFGQSEEPKASGATPFTSGLFGAKSPGLASTTPFGKPPGESSVLETSTTPFGKPPGDAAASEGQSKSLFGGLNSSTPSTQPQTSSLFGASTNDKPTTSLFGPTNGDKPAATTTLFGTPSTAAEKSDSGASKKRRSNSDAAEEQPKKKYTFGGDAPTYAEKLPPKTPAAAKGATDAASVFGAPAQPDRKYLFGAASTTPAVPPPSTTPAPPTTAPTSLFGNNTTTPATTAPTSLFGNTTTPATTEPAKTQSSLFGAPSANTGSSGFTFGSTTPATNPPTSLFASQNTAAAPNPPTTSLFGTQNNSSATASGGLFGSQTSQAPPSSLFSSAKTESATATQTPSFSFGNNTAPAQSSGSFTFGATSSGGGGGGGDSFNNPFASGGGGSRTPSFEFGAPSNASGSAPFQFGGGGASSTPAPATFSFGGGSQPTNGTAAPSGSLFGAGAPATNGGGSSSMFSFGGSSQQPSQSGSSSLFSGQPANAAQGIFASQLAAPPAGSSTGTNTPLFGGASSIATTPAAGTPEPEAVKKDGANGTADEDAPPQDQQVSLTDAGPGEEDEEVVHEVRAKALRHVPVKPDDDADSKKKNNSPWQPEGLGPLRILKHKTSGSVRILLRTEPSGRVAMNKLVLPNFTYKVDTGAKWLKVTTAKDDGKGLETWMIQVKNNEFAVKLAAVLEDNKNANK